MGNKATISIVSMLALGTAYAQALEEVNADVLNFDGTFATIEISWNDNSGVSHYKAGCVSCMPNLSDTTTENLIVLINITPLADGNAVLYVLAYDDANEIISVKQVILQLL